MNGITTCQRLALSCICCLVLPLVLGIVTPLAILFAVAVIVGHYSITQATQEVLNNPMFGSSSLYMFRITLLPFFALSVFVFMIQQVRSQTFAWVLCVCGLAAILLVMIPLHVIAWLSIYNDNWSVCHSMSVLLFTPLLSMASLLTIVTILWGAVSSNPSLAVKVSSERVSRLATMALIAAVLSLFKFFYVGELLFVASVVLAVIALLITPKQNSISRKFAFLALAIAALNLVLFAYSLYEFYFGTYNPYSNGV